MSACRRGYQDHTDFFQRQKRGLTWHTMSSTITRNNANADVVLDNAVIEKMIVLFRQKRSLNARLRFA